MVMIPWCRTEWSPPDRAKWQNLSPACSACPAENGSVTRQTRLDASGNHGTPPRGRFQPDSELRMKDFFWVRDSSNSNEHQKIPVRGRYRPELDEYHYWYTRRRNDRCAQRLPPLVHCWSPQWRAALICRSSVVTFHLVTTEHRRALTSLASPRTNGRRLAHPSPTFPRVSLSTRPAPSFSPRV